MFFSIFEQRAGNRSLFILLLSGMLKTVPLFSQGIVGDVTFKLAGFSVDSSRTSSENERITAFWEQLRFLDGFEREQIKFNGQLDFGLSGDEAGENELFKLSGGINISRGIYPGRLQFESRFGVVLNNQQFNENVSSINIAYTYFPTLKPEKMLWENEVYLSRFTDAFLGVQQRYEAGFGIVMHLWSKQKTKAGADALKVINRMKIDAKDYDLDTSIWALCREYCTHSAKADFERWEVEELQRVQNRTRSSLRRGYSRVHLALQLGLLAETEKVDFGDTLLTSNGPVFREVDFAATQKLRLSLRPQLEVQPNDSWILRFQPHLKFPVPWVGRETAVNSEVDPRFDLRLDLKSNLSIKLAKGETPNKSVRLRFSYDIHFDNAPQRQLLSNLRDANDEPILFSAARIHHVYQMALSVGF